MGSPLQNSESETILRNIVMLQKKVNPEAWTPFSWDDYKSFCTHRATDSEHRVLEAFVNGGKPVSNCSVSLAPGWLKFQDEKYSLSNRMIAMLEDYSDTNSGQ